MIRNANNVNCVGKRNLRCCMFTIQTRRNAGAYANDDLGGTNTIAGNTAVALTGHGNGWHNKPWVTQ